MKQRSVPSVHTIYAQFPQLKQIVHAIIAHDGRALLVGGAVRDLVCHLPIKDIDIEVHAISLDTLHTILQHFGPVSLVGKSFGVLRLHGLNVDWSLPRSDSSGRNPHVVINPMMSIEDAARRRDLTMNAMAIDMATGTFIDPFGGMHDIKNKILRTPDPHFFVQDPLRFYRVMQFIGRFQMMPDEQLNGICTTMDISSISRERIEEEFKKLFLQSAQPSLGIRWIQQLGRLGSVLPELNATVGVMQSPRWHPEGDVFEHSMQSLDAAAIIAKKYDLELNQLVLMYSALCHDLGKSTTSRIINGEIRSFGHDHEGARIAQQMLKHITHNSILITTVSILVKNHMIPCQLVSSHASLSAYKRLARKLFPYTTIRILADLCLADSRGRNPLGHTPLTSTAQEIIKFLEKSNAASVSETIERPILQGKDLLTIMHGGPRMGALLKHAYEIQIEEGIQDKEILKQRIIDLIDRERKDTL